MPTFYIVGIKIEFFYNDHPPPHFHASIAEYEALVSIRDHQLLKGNLPGNKRKKILDWAAENESILMEIWHSFKKDS